jgi:uncharacterized metal-binding protein YceD (DUF177 family)
MEDQFKIYVDRLRDNEVEKINERVEPGVLLESDSELRFEHPVDFQGEAYIAEKELVLHLNISTTALLPCAICNEETEAPLKLVGVYHVVPLDEIKGAIFDLKDFLRETIILEAPRFVECHEGSCPKRKDFERFMKKEKTQSNPFSQLEHEE